MFMNHAFDLPRKEGQPPLQAEAAGSAKVGQFMHQRHDGPTYENTA
jgi:hypothetical protein